MKQANGPNELEFKSVWQRRWIFSGELPFPEGMSFLPAAHYSATVTEQPFEMRIEGKDGQTLAVFPAPENAAVPFVMHLSLSGRHSAAVFVEKDGAVTLGYTHGWEEDVDPRRKEYVQGMSVCSNHKDCIVRRTLSAGIGQADVRFVTRGRENALYWEDGRLFFTFSARAFGSHLGVASLDPASFDVRFEGEIMFDYGDGLLRNDLAAHLFHDDETGQWRAWCSNFSTSGDKLNTRAPGGLNVAWCNENPLHGFHVMNAKTLGLTGMNEDPSGIWDPQVRKWRLFVSAFDHGIHAQMLESDSWDGPYVPLTERVPEDSTGTTIQWMNGTRYCFAGSADSAMFVYSYPMLEKLGTLHLDRELWGETPVETPWGPMITRNSRVWPCFAELPNGYPFDYLLLTMDRINFPGMPVPNWTYGGLHLYGAKKRP